MILKYVRMSHPGYQFLVIFVLCGQFIQASVSFLCDMKRSHPVNILALLMLDN